MGRLDTVALVSALARAAAITTVAFKTSRYIPPSLKWLFIFLVSLNIRGFPLVWHFRVVIPWFSAILKQKLVHRVRGRSVHLTRLTSISPVGHHPLRVVETWKGRAGIADCDYNGHLSNSSYAKNIDYCRLNAAVRFYPGFTGLGGYLPIAGTYHQFLKEIPLNAEYEIHLYQAGWEEAKWAYLTVAFITRPQPQKGGKKTQKLEAKAETAAKELLKGVPGAENSAATPSTNAPSLVVPPVAEVTSTADSSVAPSGLATPSVPLLSGSATPARASLEETKTLLGAIPIPEGATLHAVAVSQYCFKLGRITVPPRVALTVAGFGDASRWERLTQIRNSPDGEKKLKQLIRGGWRDPSEGDFWDFKDCDAEGRKAGEALKQLRFVMGALGGTGEGNLNPTPSK